MSQIPSQVCPQCGANVEAGNRFCPNCGSMFQPVEPKPTVAASGIAGPPANPNNVPFGNIPSSPGYNIHSSSPPNPSYSDIPTTLPSAESSTYPGATPPPPRPHTQYNSGAVPPPPPLDPYAPVYSTAPQKKKRSALVPIMIAVVIIVLVAGGTGIYALVKNSSGSGGNIGIGGGVPTPTNNLTLNPPLTVTYASDQITFTNIQQAAKFSDDSETSYSFTNIKDYVRVSFNEKQTATSSSYFSYFSTFRLTLPNGSIVQAQKSEEFSGPEQGVQRPNWVDFPSASGEVDLASLKMTLGSSDETQETFPLKPNADVSKYQPKTFTLNSTFKYAGMDMTIKSVTQSYYYNGQQAKTGKVFLAIALNGDNNQNADIYLSPSGFLRLKTSDATVSPDYSSDLNNFDIINPNTTGITGTAIFDVTPSPDGKYTLIFEQGDHIAEVDEPIQLS